MSNQCLSVLNDDSVLLYGYYKKLKTMKKKFFVLCCETSCKAARIEYYDSEKKYKSGFSPKRVIKIKNCFNINRRLHAKHGFVIVLASNDGGFGIVMDSEAEMNTWLSHLLHLQRSGETFFDFPNFDCVWQVIIQRKGVAEHHNIFGSHHICLTNKSITFIKFGREKKVEEKKINKIDVLLTTIRRCGDSQCYFYMEIGRQSSLGAGELWMETEDSQTAQNMHEMILSKMVLLNETIIEPMRKRSSSATENLHYEMKSTQNMDVTSNYLSNVQNFSRARCDSLPSRNRTASECSNHRTIRMIPTSPNRINYNISKTSPVAYSASEEFATFDGCEERTERSCKISSKSSENVIREEHINKTSHFQHSKGCPDFNSLTSSMGPSNNGSLSPIKAHNADRTSNVYNDICNISNEQLQTCSLANKCEYDKKTKDDITNRVRAFSVGSQMKSARICSKTSPKLFNSNSVDCSTRKSISVPVLINKNLQSTDQMGDLMEIDFSKPIDRHFYRTKRKNQNISNMLSRNLFSSNSQESLLKSKIKPDNSYLEMKPITLDSKNAILNNCMNGHSQCQKACEINVTSPTSVYISTDSKQQFDSSITSQPDDFNVSKDLYYASLDLPKCGNQVNNRYGFQDSLNNVNFGEVRSEYAKINFIPSDSLKALSMKK